ncbi:hypothetical protein DV735_g145, partial [Chaetothyriales sp. CBS 134920]
MPPLPSQQQRTTSMAEPGSEAATLKLIENVLDYIRANLSNIERVWGADSVQYKSASEIMNSYLDENLRAHSVDKEDIADLLAKMSVGDDTRR